MWEGDTYYDTLKRFQRGGTFPPCESGLTVGAAYDLIRLIEYSFARVGEKDIGIWWARRIVYDINEERILPVRDKYLKQWAQREANLRFLQWLICKVSGPDDSATKARLQADVIDYLTMELTGHEFEYPGYRPA